MLKNTVIICLIILLIYCYYQQNNPSIDKRSFDNLIQDLKRQVQHYQNLYQRRVSEDVDKLNNREEKGTQTDLSDQQINLLTQQWNQVAQWATEIGIDVNKKWNLGLLKEKLEQEKTQLTQLQQEQAQEKTQSTQHIQRLNKQITALTILADKRKEDLEQEKQTLITLAKQKIANKKEASELLKELEGKWQQDKEEWEEEKKRLTEQGEQEKNDWEKERKNYEKRLLANRQEFDKWIKVKQDDDRLFKEQITEKDQAINQLKTKGDNLQQSITDLQNKIKKLRDNNQEKEEKTKELLASIHQFSQDRQKLTEELQAKERWKDKNLPQLKQELFSQAQNVYQELRNQIRVATIAWGRKEIGEKLEELEEFFTFSQKETQTPPIVKFSQNTQTSLINENVDKLFSQWNQVAQWAEELGVDTNQKWNLGMLKNKIKQELETAKKNPSTSSRSTQNSDDKDLENTLDNLIKSIQDLNQQL